MKPERLIQTNDGNVNKELEPSGEYVLFSGFENLFMSLWIEAKCVKSFGEKWTLAKYLDLAQETQVFHLLRSRPRKYILEFRNKPVKTSSKSVFFSKIFQFWHNVSWSRKYFILKILTSSINVIMFIKYICNSS